MGSPVSAVMANLHVFVFLEELVLESAPLDPVCGSGMWMRHAASLRLGWAPQLPLQPAAHHEIHHGAGIPPLLRHQGN